MNDTNEQVQAGSECSNPLNGRNAAFRFGGRDLLAMLLLAAACAAMYLPRLGARGPWTAGEGRAVLTPRVMRDRGEWVAMRMPNYELHVTDVEGIPYIDEDTRSRWLDPLADQVERTPDGRVRPHDFDFEQRITIHKPIGYYWLIDGLNALGMPITVTTARLTSSVSAILTVLAVYLLGAYMISRRAGLIAAAALATSVHFIWIARVAKMDMVVTLLMTAALGLFYVAHTSRRTWLASMLMYLSIAGAVLIKGPGYLGIPVLAIMTFLGFDLLSQPARRFWAGLEGRSALVATVVASLRFVGAYFAYVGRQMWRMHVVTGVVLIAAAVVPWYVLIHVKTGGQWTEVMFIRHHLARFFSEYGFQYGKEFEKTTTPAFYFYMVWILLFPWIIFLPGAAVEVFRRRTRPLLGQGLFLLAWLGFMLLFFTMMSFRKDEYLMPAYPAAMLLAGFLLDRYLPSRSRPDYRPTEDKHLHRAIVSAYLFVAVAALALVGFAVAMRWPQTMKLVFRLDDNLNTQTAMRVFHRFVLEQGWALAAFGGVCGALLIAMVWAQLSRRYRLAVGLLAVGSALIVATATQVLMTQVNPYRTERPFAEQVTRLAKPGDPIVYFLLENHELTYWLDQAGREQAGRPNVYPIYDMGFVGPRPRRLDVLLAQCEAWADQGRSPWVVMTNRLWHAGLLADTGAFEQVDLTDPLGADYLQRHRMPLVLLRFVGSQPTDAPAPAAAATSQP